MALSLEDQERMVSDLEVALERLQALYNQYFMGIEKLEPSIPRKDVERKIQTLRREQIRNTAVRFRFQTQIQKYNTQSNYWRRICRQIEEGTYQRDIMRAKKRTEKRDEAAVAAKALDELDSNVQKAPPVVDLSTEMDMDLDDPFAAPKAESEAEVEKPTEPPPPHDPGLSDPDKTPIPAVGTGVHHLHEKLINDARNGHDNAGESGGADDLSSFFSRKSIPPPPPRGETPPPPMPSQAPATPVDSEPHSDPKPAPRSSLTPSPPEPAPRPAVKKPAAKKPAAKKPATSDTPARKTPARATTVDDKRMKAVYRAYVSARKKTNESTDNLSFAKVSRLLQKQIKEKEGVKDFKVVIRKGKAVIKTVKD